MSGSRRKILVVDDQPDSRIFVETILSEIGDYDVDTATNGDEAYAKIFSNVPDLAILDVMMPGMDGFTLFRDLRNNEVTKGLPIIMCTGVSSELGSSFVKRAEEEKLGPPPVAFLDKPIEPETLRAALSLAFGV